MNFELNPELVENLIYGMENQELMHVLDSKTLKVLPESELDQLAIEEEGRILPLPLWRPMDGFKLMEDFVTSIHNPSLKEELRTILKSGRGVFRQFKDAIKSRPEIERLWFSWKQKEMQRRVYDWYNELRETWGLLPLSWEEEADKGLNELVLWDFEFTSVAPEEMSWLLQLDRQYFDEAYSELTQAERDLFFKRYRLEIPLPQQDPLSKVHGAFTPNGELVGFIWYWINQDFIELVQLAVNEEFRGLGIARRLIDCFHKDIKEQQLKTNKTYPLFCQLPTKARFLERTILLELAMPITCTIRI